jgi:hypothetical protein
MISGSLNFISALHRVTGYCVGAVLAGLFVPSFADGDDEIPRSPLFGAVEFSQQMLRMEELGSALLDPDAQLPVFPFPQPTVGPVAVELSTDATPAGFSGEGTLQVWRLENSSGGWSHPVHVHFEESVLLNRDGKAPPEWERWARKDMFRIGPEADASKSLEIAFHVREFVGTYMEHCHNTQHEDHSMLLRWDAQHPGQIVLMPAPFPTWDGVEFVDSKALPKFRTGDGLGPQGNGSGNSGKD